MNEHPRAQLNAFDIGCVVTGGIIGVGIFFTPQRVAASVDDSFQVIVAWGIGGVIAILGALVFAELAVRLPGHGGTFRYIENGIGRLPAFLYGWANWLVIQAGALGVIGLVMVDNADVMLFGASTTSAGVKVLVTCLAIAAFTALNVVGLRVGKSVQNGLTVLKTLAVFSLVLMALITTGQGHDAAQAVSESSLVLEPKGFWRAMSLAILPVLFSFGGWQQGSFLAGAARRPKRDVPIGIIGGVVVVVIAYLTVNLAFLDLLGFEGAATAKTIGADAARVALSEWGEGGGDTAARLLAGMVVISSLGIMNTICMAPPYVLHEMAKQGLFLKSASKLHAHFGTPVVGVLGQGLWGIALLVIVHFCGTKDTLGFLLDGVVFVDWLFFGLCGYGLLRMRRRSAEKRTGGFAGTCVVLAFTCLAVLVAGGAVFTTFEPSVYGLGMCALGLPVYFFALRRS